MKLAWYSALAICGLVLVISGCSKQQESPKVERKPHPYPEVTMSPPADQVALAESLVYAHRMITYQSLENRYRFRYDTRKVSLVEVGQRSLKFLHDSKPIATLYTISIAQLYNWAQETSWGVRDLARTSLLPDTAFALALSHMANKYAADGDDGSAYLALPPTRLTRDTTFSGQRFIKILADYISETFSNSSSSRTSVGPIYCVDVSVDERRIILGIRPDGEKSAPKEVEAFLDTLVKSVEIVR